MKKMRAILAVLIAAAAVMGMTASAEAAKSTHILVDELDGFYWSSAAECDGRYSGYGFDDAILADNTQDWKHFTCHRKIADSSWYLDAKKRCRRL